MPTLDDDVKDQRQGLTDDHSGGEQDERGDGSKPDDEHKLRDSARPCLFVAALLTAFGAIALIVIGTVVAAFGNGGRPLALVNSSGDGDGGGLSGGGGAGGGPRTLASSPADSRYVFKSGVLPDDPSVWRVRWYDAQDAWRPLTWADALGLLAEGKLFMLTQALRISPHVDGGFYWELPPLTMATAASTPFEMVTLPAPHLGAAGADPGPFRGQLGPCAGTPAARAFPNLGGDATLVAPCAAKLVPSEVYRSLAHFVRGAPTAQTERLWIELGVALQARLSAEPSRPAWVSTEGSGVAWVHVRLDERPKYFHHAPYAKWEPTGRKRASEEAELKR